MEKCKGEKVGLLIVLALVTISACRSVAKVDSNVAAVRAMRVVRDDLDREVIVPVRITRAISLAPSLTESIFAVGAGDRLVGVTSFCDYPEAAKSVAKVGDTMSPNMESIIALKPDLVFVSTASQIEAFTKTLEQNGIAVYVTNPTSLGDVIQELEQLSIIFGTDSKIEEYVYELRKRVGAVGSRTLMGRLDPGHETIEFKVEPVRVFIQISKEPLFTIGEASYLNDLIRTAGGISITADVPTAFPKLSKETALALLPDAIILSDSPDNQEPNEVFRNSPAVKNGRVYKLDADLLSRPGPRLVDALEQIAAALHPEKL